MAIVKLSMHDLNVKCCGRDLDDCAVPVKTMLEVLVNVTDNM